MLVGYRINRRERARPKPGIAGRDAGQSEIKQPVKSGAQFVRSGRLGCHQSGLGRLGEA